MNQKVIFRTMFGGALIASVTAGLTTSSSSCGGSSNTPTTGDASGGASNDSGAGGGSLFDTGGAAGAGTGGGAARTYSDFPTAPVVAGSLPANVGSLFGMATATGAAPCVSEPAAGAMIPANWTPLHFEWSPAPGQSVFEIKLHVDNQKNDFIAYTDQASYTLDVALWKALSANSRGHDIAVTVRGGTLAGGAVTDASPAAGSFALHLAPVEAPGSVVYWSPGTGMSSFFKGFGIGDTSSVVVLSPAINQAAKPGDDTQCVSCHTSSPDGKYLIYVRDGEGSRSVDMRTTDGKGNEPDQADVSSAALSLLGRSFNGAPVLSKAHFAPGDSFALSIYSVMGGGDPHSQLIWTDLNAKDTSNTYWGFVARNGDARQATNPSWSHDGASIVYTSTEHGEDGVTAGANGTDTDVFVVPYNNHQGGDAKPLRGASDPAVQEYYSVFSPDDSLVAFNRNNAPTPKHQGSYNNPHSELYVVPFNKGEGGESVRLTANDPPACTSLTSPGLTNSWPRWAPEGTRVGDKKYYWVVFSSNRHITGVDLIPQLYVAAIVTKLDAAGRETIDATYPAVYVASQSPDEHNHIPAWDVFRIATTPH